MKPSNTGIGGMDKVAWALFVATGHPSDFFQDDPPQSVRDMRGRTVVAYSAALEYGNRRIAEYRKELAAKVEGLPRFAPITKDGPGFSHFAMMDEYSGGDWVRLSDMRALLNENDDA